MSHLATYVGLLHTGEQTLADSFRTVGHGHAEEADVFHICNTLAGLSEQNVERLGPIAARYGEQHGGEDIEEPERLHADGVAQVRSGAVGLLRDLQDLYLLCSLAQTSWTVILQAAQGIGDRDLLGVAGEAVTQNARQLKWLTTRLKIAAPQALIAAP